MRTSSVLKYPQPSRHVVLSQLMSASGTELVRDTDRAEAVPTARRHLVGALRAEVELALNLRSAGRAA